MIRYVQKHGGTITDFITGLTNPFSLVIGNRYVYWSDNNDRVGGTGGAKRENLPSALNRFAFPPLMLLLLNDAS